MFAARPPRRCARTPAGVDKLIFVGSTVVGQKVMAAAAETLTPVVLELGGKDAVIVCDDANVDEVRLLSIHAFECLSHTLCVLTPPPLLHLLAPAAGPGHLQGGVPEQRPELRRR